MTKPEAIYYLVASYQIAAQTIDINPDPAGSTYTYEPWPKDLEVIQAIIGRPVAEVELFFCTGNMRPHYYMVEALAREVVSKLNV